MRRRLAAATLAAALAAPAALGDNASATLLPGDLLHGDIQTPGDRDVLSIYLPGGSTFSVDALADADSAILPSLEVHDPEDQVMDLSALTTPGPGGVGVRVRKVPLFEDEGGVYTFLVTAGEGSSGRYLFRCTAKQPRKYSGSPTIGQEAYGGISFDAPAGSTLKYAVKPLGGGTFSMRSLRAPDDSETPLEDFADAGIPLDQDGTWDLFVNNDGAEPAEVSIVVSLALPKGKRVLYLSPLGFGPPPRVRSVTPRKVLDDRPATGMVLAGEGFDPEATVRLERNGEDPVEPTSFTVDDEGTITADFDVTGIHRGAWKVVVQNPSGGAAAGRLAVQTAGSVKLPAGARTGTEVWWLDFDKQDFLADLDAMGLGSSDSVAAILMDAAVQSYAVYWVRRAFGAVPLTGKMQEGSVPVSFVLGKLPSTVGTPGSGFDRLEIGGEAGGGDASSNPNYPWGNGPLDAGNAAYEDLSREVAPDLGIRARALVATSSGSIAAYYDAIQPLRAQPLTAADRIYFLRSFTPTSGAEGARYRVIAAAADAAGKEIAGTIAHFVARSMGVADGVSGLSAVPTKNGEYAALAPASFGFTQGERDAMIAAARAGVPGTSKVLHANYFGYRETLAYLLPDATTSQPYSVSFVMGGGRPDRDPNDLQYTGIAGVIPAGFTLSATGTVSGTSPLRNPDSTLNGGVFRFLVRMKDQVSGDDLLFAHRINLLVDVGNPALSPAEVALGNQKNTQTVTTP